MPIRRSSATSQGLTLLATLPRRRRGCSRNSTSTGLGPAGWPPRALGSRGGSDLRPGPGVMRRSARLPQLFPTLRGLWRFYLNRGIIDCAGAGGAALAAGAGRAASSLSPGGRTPHSGRPCSTWANTSPPSHTSSRASPSPTSRRSRLWGSAMERLGCRGAWPWRPGPCGASGFPTQALRRGQEALAQAQACAHPYSLAMAQTG